MAPYNSSNNNQHSNVYDPVGSQSRQPTGYTHQTATSNTSQYPSPATSNYQNTGYQDYGSSSYANQQYGATGQGSSNTTNQAATALSNLSANYPQPSSTSGSSTNNNAGYDQSSWGTSNYGSYTAANMQPPNRTQSNNSPLYATQGSSSTFGRLSVPEQTQSSSNNYAQQAYQNARATASATPSNQSYQTAHTQAAQQTQSQTQQPQRYASPLHALQAQQQQGHSKQPSRSSAHQASPQMTQQSMQHQASHRQPSASVEPSPTTVDPSQVYDDRAERQRKAQIEAEKRRKREDEEAARKAEEERIAAEKRKEEEQKRKFEEGVAKKKAEAARKAEERKKKREEKRQGKTAATALQKMASSGTMAGPASEGPPANDEEAEMRAMFKKMREFNAKNPAMLAKMWEEERTTAQSPPTKATPTPAPVQRQQAGSAMAPPAPQSNASAQQQYRPFQKPPPPSQKTTAQVVATSNQPVAGQSNTSFWPPQKKGALADAAAKWLTALPEQGGRIVKKEELLKILEANPSYVQLCEALEGIGLRFERSLLARELLKSVPDGLKTAGPQPGRATPQAPLNGIAGQANSPADTPKKKRGRPTKDRSSMGNQQNGYQPSTGTVDYEAPRFTSLADAARDVNSMGAAPTANMQGGPVQPPPSFASPYFGLQPPAINGSRAPSQSQPPEQKPIIKPEEPRKPPANKEEAARKTFGDLVDLTAEDSDDDGPPKKTLQTANGQLNGVNGQQPPPPLPGAAAGFKQFKQPMSFNDFYRHGQCPPQPGWNGQPPIHNFAPPPARMLPSMPQQPPMQPVMPRPKGPSAESKQQERIKGRMLVEPIMRDRVARKSKYDSRTIARDVLLATGRHPDMRALNQHLANMQRLLGTHGGGFDTEGGRGDRSDLSTIRWDIIDPGEPTEKAESKKPVPAAAGEDVTADADDEDNEPEMTGPARHVARRAVDSGDGTAQYVSVHEQLSGKPAMPKKRRGRPPRHSMPSIMAVPNTQGGGGERQSLGQRDTSTLHRQATAAAPRSAPAGGRVAAGSPAGTPSGGAPVGYAAFRQIDEAGNVVKKRGRPVGWRKDIHSREAQGLEPAKPGHNPSRLRQSNKPGEEVGPKYQVWKCQWKGCNAELHNLDTLKKHVVKIHGKPNEAGQYECLWQPCDAEIQHAGKGKGKAGAASFEEIDGWVGHMDKEHLQPVAWKLGDGPKGGMCGKSPLQSTWIESIVLISELTD